MWQVKLFVLFFWDWTLWFAEMGALLTATRQPNPHTHPQHLLLALLPLQVHGQLPARPLPAAMLKYRIPCLPSQAEAQILEPIKRMASWPLYGRHF